MDRTELDRLRWQCRRGMLENDIVLERFLEKHGDSLAGQRLQAFKALLDYSDNDLWDLVNGRSQCRDPAEAEVLELLRAC